MRHLLRTLLPALALVPLALACAPEAPARPIVRASTPVAAPVANSHVVGPGETLELIAARYDIDEAELASLNGLEADAPLVAGQPLMLPEGVDTSTFGPAPDDEALGPAVAARGPTEVVVTFVVPRPPPWGWYDSMLARPGGEVIVVGGGLAVLAALAFGFVWLVDLAREQVPTGLAAAWRAARSAWREVYFAGVWVWIGMRWLGLRLERLVARPASRLLAQLLGTGSQRATQAWEASRPVVASQAERAFDAGGEALGEQLGEVRRRLDEWLVRRGWRSRAGVVGRRKTGMTTRRVDIDHGRTAGGATELVETWPPTESQMLAALEQRELKVEFRPVVDAQSGDIAGTLSSVSWEHPSEGLLREQRVLAAMQRPEFKGVRRTLLRATLLDACGLVAHARDRHPQYRAIVPLLAEQLFDPEIDVYVETAIAHVGAPADGVDLAVDERWVAGDLERVASVLERLRRLGVRTTLTGYGTLDGAALHRLGVATVTVDFFQCLRDAKARSFVEEAVRTARAAGFPVLATGAETADEVALVKQLGCALAAGDAFGQGQSATMLRTGLRAAA